MRSNMLVFLHEFTELFGEHPHDGAGVASGGYQHLPECCWHALVQCPTTYWFDVEPVALQPDIKGAVTLIDSNADTGFLESLGQSKSPDASANDEDVQGG